MGERRRVVGLGRVVEDRTSASDRRPEPDGDSRVERDSADSFPASDPPAWTSEAATPEDGTEEVDTEPAEPHRPG